MRVVLDTNILVSAMLVQGSVPDQVLQLALGGRFTWLVDARIVAEYREVLHRATFGFRRAVVSEVLAVVDEDAEWVVASPLPLRIRDESDLPFLEVAVAGGADAIVTGNAGDFRVEGGRLALRVLTPRAFLDFLAGRAR